MPAEILPLLLPLTVLGLSSLFLHFAVIRRVLSGKPILEPSDRPRPDPPLAAVLFVLVLVVPSVMYFVMNPLAKNTPLDPETLPSLCLFQGTILILLLLPVISDREKRGLNLSPWREQSVGGMFGYLYCVLPVGMLMLASIPFRSLDQQHQLLTLLGTVDWLVLLQVFLLAVVLAPLAEELMYRVILQSWLERFMHPREALFVTAVVFCMVHQLPDAVPLLPLALTLGYMYQQRRGYLAVVVTHALFNLTNLLLALSGQ